MNIFDQISEDIKAAMKARDKVRLDTLRNIKKVFLEAKTAPGANDTLEDADALKIIQKLAKRRHTLQTTGKTLPTVSWHRLPCSKNISRRR